MSKQINAKELAGTVDELAEDLTRLANQAEEIGDTFED